MSRRKDLFGKTLYVDIVTNMLLLFMFLWIVSMAIERAKVKQLEDANVRTEGLFAIVAQWPDASNDDVDLYVRDPVGNIAIFGSRDVGLMHLEHDDQGTVSDQAQTELGVVKVAKNEERIILRGVIAGEYTVNVHMYNKHDASPTKVKVRLVRLKGEDADMVEREPTLAVKGDERTAFRFTLGADESVSSVNELQRHSVGVTGPQGGPQGGF